MEERLEAETRLAPATPEPAAPTVLAEDIPGNTLSPEVQALIGRCMDGTEPIENARDYHVDKFSPRHLQIVMMRIAGMRPGEIATLMETSGAWVSIILGHPYSRKIMKAAMPGQMGRVIDIRAKLERYADKLLDETFHAALAEEDLEKQAKVTFGLLDRAGFQPVNKNLNVNVPVKPATQDPRTLDRIAGALEESNLIDAAVMPAWTPPRPPEDGSTASAEEGAVAGGVGVGTADQSGTGRSAGASSSGDPQSTAPRE